MPSARPSRKSAAKPKKLYQYVSVPRAEAIADATQAAKQQAIAAGAVPATVDVVDIDELPLQYAPGEATRVKVKVVGQMA
ncbi:hypothetical protein [Lacticaseibacillus nasuensis]|uniref:hypothetical protein n=1 Tax=Lacticaseibacillus nasuensis TaxID=944671 RepID=UPI0006CF769A|nr:hypothetical protein [Lacticaseibacillus nasuensis]